MQGLPSKQGTRKPPLTKGRFWPGLPVRDQRRKQPSDPGKEWTMHPTLMFSIGYTFTR